MNSPDELRPATARRNEWLLVAFTGTTNIADAVTRVALPLLTVGITTSPIVVTAVAALMTLPWLLTALHIGVFVDRMDRRTLMMGAEIARTASVAVILLAYFVDAVNLPLIYLVALVLGVADVLAGVSGAAILPNAIPKKRWQKVSERVTGLEYLANGFLGTPIGGFLTAAGFAVAFGVSGLVYAVGALLLLSLVGKFKVEPTTERKSVHAEIKDGLKFLFGNRLLRTMSLMITAMAACWGAWLALIPVYAVGGPLGLSAQQYGLLLTWLGAGGVVGSLLVGWINRLLGRRWSMFVDIIGSFALVAAPAFLPAEPGSAYVIGAAAFVAGAGGVMWTANSRVITQTFVPAEMMGRYSAAARVVAWGASPIAAVLSGVIAQFAGYRWAFGVFAALCLAIVIPFFRVVTPEAVAAVDQPDEPGDEAEVKAEDRKDKPEEAKA